MVRVFRHALALDEHRVRFKPNLWGRPEPQGALGTTPQVVTDVKEVSMNHSFTFRTPLAYNVLLGLVRWCPYW